MLINASNNNIPLDTVFMTLVNPDGTTYQLWGSNDINVNNLSIFDQNTIETILNNKYSAEYDLAKPNQSSQFYQEKFLKFMKEKMNVVGSKFYSIDDSGNASQISISQGSLDFPTPCPN